MIQATNTVHDFGLIVTFPKTIARSQCSQFLREAPTKSCCEKKHEDLSPLVVNAATTSSCVFRCSQAIQILDGRRGRSLRLSRERVHNSPNLLGGWRGLGSSSSQYCFDCQFYNEPSYFLYRPELWISKLDGGFLYPSRSQF